MTRPQRYGATKGCVDAMLGKACDAVTAFNGDMIVHRELVEYDRAEYAKSNRDAYSAECRSMRREVRS